MRLGIRISIITGLAALGLAASCGGGGGDTLPINGIPGGGGGQVSFTPPVTTPAVEGYSNLGSWKASCLDILPPATYQNPSLAAWADEVFTRVNTARTGAGLPALARSHGLDRIAQAQARDMALRNYFSHTNPDGQLPWDRLAMAGLKDYASVHATSDIAYNGVAENAAKGQESAEAIVNGWLQSPGHRANLMNSRYGYVGTGVYYDPTDLEMPIHAIQLYVEPIN
jgi:uncharacterized protein YkwD